jgi:hypothetical protein
MSIKNKILAAASVLTLTAGLGAAGALSSSAATPSCGPGSPTLGGCVDIFSRMLGKHSDPKFVADVFRQGAKTGQPIILFQASNTDPAEDVIQESNGNTSDFYAAGLVPAAVALHYGCTGTVPVAGAQVNCSAYGTDDPAYELEYAPFGVDSGLCIGVARTAFSGEKVTLQPCGVSGKTVWIADLNGSPSTIAHGYVPVINGSDTNFSHPFVLTYPVNGFPTDKPRPQLFVSNLTGFSQGNVPLGQPIGNVNDNQLWGADFGVLH